jgi:hypothetical protein
MGLWPTQGDEKHLDPASTLNGAVTLSLSPDRSEAQWRDLRFRGPFLRCFFLRCFSLHEQTVSGDRNSGVWERLGWNWR